MFYKYTLCAHHCEFRARSNNAFFREQERHGINWHRAFAPRTFIFLLYKLHATMKTEINSASKSTCSHNNDDDNDNDEGSFLSPLVQYSRYLTKVSYERRREKIEKHARRSAPFDSVKWFFRFIHIIFSEYSVEKGAFAT